MIDGLRSLTDPEQGVLARASHPSPGADWQANLPKIIAGSVCTSGSRYVRPDRMAARLCLFHVSDFLADWL